MKSKEEIVRHLAETPYDEAQIKKIVKFLEDNGIIETAKEPTAEDFKEWFESDEESKEFNFGDYVHLKNDTDAVVVDVFPEDKMLCVHDGVSMYSVKYEDVERDCLEEEIDVVDKRMEEECNSYYNEDYMGIMPIGVEPLEEEDDECDSDLSDLIDEIINFNEE